MACHEIAALRLGMMNVLGRRDAAERQHELAELGDAAERPGPVRSLCAAGDLATLKGLFEASISELEQRVTKTRPDDPKLPYLRTLVVLTKKTELDLANHLDALTRFHLDLDRMHDFVHELYPAE